MKFTSQALTELDNTLDVLHDRVLDEAEKIATEQTKSIVNSTIMTEAYNKVVAKEKK